MKKIINKKAFTMIELIVVIVVVGILAALMIPRMNDDKLVRAADQVLSHLQYTQHLAMQNDKFSISNSSWYKQRWQIAFNNLGYTIFADDNHNNIINQNEVAIDPLNSSKILSNGISGTLADGKTLSKKVDLGSAYGITAINFSNGCNNQSRISFDFLGRPFAGNPFNLTSPYSTGLITQNCDIILIKGSNRATIEISPETGYSRIKSIN